MDIEYSKNGNYDSKSPLVHDGQRLERLLQSLEREKSRLSSLPRNSQYVKHRLLVINRTLNLLSVSGTASLAQNDSELASLLSSLSL